MTEPTALIQTSRDEFRAEHRLDELSDGELGAFARAVELAYEQQAPGGQQLDISFSDRRPEDRFDLDDTVLQLAVLDTKQRFANRDRDGVPADATTMLAAPFPAHEWVRDDDHPTLRALRHLTDRLDRNVWEHGPEDVYTTPLAVCGDLYADHVNTVQQWLDRRMVEHGTDTWAIDVEIVDLADQEQWRTLHPGTVACQWPDLDEPYQPSTASLTDPDDPYPTFGRLIDPAAARTILVDRFAAADDLTDGDYVVLAVMLDRIVEQMLAEPVAEGGTKTVPGDGLPLR